MTSRGEKGLKHNEMIHLVNAAIDEDTIFLEFSVDEPASFFYCFSQFEPISATCNQRFQHGQRQLTWLSGDGCDGNGREKADMIS